MVIDENDAGDHMRNVLTALMTKEGAVLHPSSGTKKRYDSRGAP